MVDVCEIVKDKCSLIYVLSTRAVYAVLNMVPIAELLISKPSEIRVQAQPPAVFIRDIGSNQERQL